LYVCSFRISQIWNYNCSPCITRKGLADKGVNNKQKAYKKGAYKELNKRPVKQKGSLRNKQANKRGFYGTKQEA
jgi:hypothetical protein